MPLSKSSVYEAYAPQDDQPAYDWLTPYLIEPNIAVPWRRSARSSVRRPNMNVKDRKTGNGQSADANYFLLLTYVLSWIIEIPAGLAAYGVVNVHVSNGLQTLAQLTPAVAALLTVGWFRGRGGVRPLLASVLKGRVAIHWYALALFVPWTTQAVAVLLYRTSGHALPALGPWYNLPLLTAALALFSVGEELGWRGFFLSRLMDRYAPLAVTGYVAFFLGILASALLPRTPFRRRAHRPDISPLPWRHFPSVCLFHVHLHAYPQRIALHDSPWSAQLRSSPLVRPDDGRRFARVRNLDGGAMDRCAPGDPRTR